MKVFNGVAELQKSVGTHLGHSDWHTIDQAQIDAFAAVTKYHQWIHVDTVRATDAHTFLTLSLPTLTKQTYKVEGFPTEVNSGADQFRIPSPVTAGSRIRAGVEMTSVTSKSLGPLVGTQVAIEQNGSDTSVCMVDMFALVAL